MHDHKNDDGVWSWYVPQGLTSEIKSLAEATKEMVNASTRTAKNQESIIEELKRSNDIAEVRNQLKEKELKELGNGNKI
jgi:hypothetical protein